MIPLLMSASWSKNYMIWVSKMSQKKKKGQNDVNEALLSEEPLSVAEWLVCQI